MKSLVLGEDDFAKEIADKLSLDFVKINSFIFPDGEIKPVIENETIIEEKKVLLVIRTNRFRPSTNDSMMKIYFLCNLLQELKVKEINLFLPYMFYSRQDKKFLPGETNSFSNVAKLYENLNIANIFTVNSHLYGKQNPLQDYFKTIKIHDFSTSKIFADYLKTKSLVKPIVIGPGKGPTIMVKELSKLLNAPYECFEKERDHKTQKIVIKSGKSDLKNRVVIIYDDVAAGGGTIVKTFEIVKQSKPNKIFIALSHLVTREGIEKLYRLNANEIITTNSFISEEKINLTELPLLSLIKQSLEHS